MPSASAPLVALDANALDRDGSPRDALVERLLTAAAAGELRLFLPEGVRAEMTRPGAPAAVRTAALALAAPEAAPGATLGAVPGVAPGASPSPAGVRGPTARQHIDRIRVRAIMRGDGRPGKHDADASHLSEAAEAGCDAFLTRDGKVLRRRDVLRAALPPRLRIATLEEFMAGSRPGDPARDGPAWDGPAWGGPAWDGPAWDDGGEDGGEDA